MALKRKSLPSNDEGKQEKKQVIKVNPYENPENVMELMAKICSATPSVDTDVYWNTLNEAYKKPIRGKSLAEYLEETKENLSDRDFKHKLIDFFQQISWSISTRENTKHTQIVVAGGFSSGKSSFLNRLTHSVNLLPTGVEPVSVVKTYLYCSKSNHSVSVKGVNHKNVLVSLDPSVLQAIQHANQSNIYLASVLEKLFVEIPSNELDELVFIDTPGYNNSDKANESNGKTDRETALEALGEGNVLFWLVDCERGTTVNDDLEIIKNFNGKKVFIFNKADKKGEAESKSIVEQAAQTLYKVFPKDDIIDIIAYSTLDNRVYYSKNRMSLSSIVAAAKSSGNGVSELSNLKDEIELLFEIEIDASQNAIKKIEENYKEMIDRKNQSQELYQNAKEYQVGIVKELNTVLVQSYNDVMNAADKITDASQNSLNKFDNFIKTMYHWDNTDHEYYFTNTLTPKINSAKKQYDSCCNKHYSAIKYRYYEEDYRKDLVKRVNDEEKIVVSRFEEWYDEECDACNDILKRKELESAIIKDMTEYKELFMSALAVGLKLYQEKCKATQLNVMEYEFPNVFDSIKKENYKAFVHSFENGVDLAVCDANGYNPLTLAVACGNNNMVDFLLNHGADSTIQDRRGYNAFHTAVENQFRDICKILLDNDPDLINTKTAGGVTVEELAQKQTFTEWIKNEIDNAF